MNVRTEEEEEEGKHRQSRVAQIQLTVTNNIEWRLSFSS